MTGSHRFVRFLLRSGLVMALCAAVTPQAYAGSCLVHPSAEDRNDSIEETASITVHDMMKSRSGAT